MDGSQSLVTLRCGFCLTLNSVDLARAQERPRCADCGKPFLLDRPVKVSQEDFRRSVLRAGAPVLVDFYADWCGPCRMVAPIMDEIAYNHTGELLVAKVDTDGAQELAREHKITSIPTVILFRDGEEAGRTIGLNPEEIRGLAREAEAETRSHSGS